MNQDIIGFNGVIYSQAIADLLTTILTVILAVGLVKKIEVNKNEENVQHDVRFGIE